MPLVRMAGAPGSGVQIDGRTYAAGEVVDLPDPWARALVQEGRAVPVPTPFEGMRVADVPMEHRDPRPTGRRR